MSGNDKSKLKERAILRERLVSLRRDLASQHGKEDAVYLIFNNTTLDDLVLKMPRSEKTMLQIKGIKEKKFQLYGSAIIDVIREYNREFHPPAPRIPKGGQNTVNIGLAAAMASHGATSMNYIHVSVSTDALRDTPKPKATKGPSGASKKKALPKAKSLAATKARPKAKSLAAKKAPPKAKSLAAKEPPPKVKMLTMVPGLASSESYPPRIGKAMTIAELKEEAHCRNLEKKSLPKTKPELLHHLVSGSIRLGQTHEFQQYHEAQTCKMSFQRFEVVRQTFHALLDRMKQEEPELLKSSLAELKGEQAKKDAGKQKAFEEWIKSKGGFDQAVSHASSSNAEDDYTEYDTGKDSYSPSNEGDRRSVKNSDNYGRSYDHRKRPIKTHPYDDGNKFYTERSIKAEPHHHDDDYRGISSDLYDEDIDSYGNAVKSEDGFQDEDDEGEFYHPDSYGSTSYMC